MRTLIVAPRDIQRGGVARVVRTLTQELRRRQHEVVLLFPGRTLKLTPRETTWDVPGFELRLQMPFGERSPIISLPIFVALFPVVLAQLLLFIRKHGTQIINIHYPTERCVYCAICRRLSSIALITSVHGADVFSQGRPSVRQSRALSYLLRRSDMVVAPSQRFRDDLAAVLPDLDARITYIHNGIDVDEF